MSKKRKVDILLDSGAFSAWRKGETIDVKAYIAFIKEYRDLVDTYVSLDTIPGDLGRMDRGQESINKSAAASYRNQQIMKDAGLAPIPVFHQGEDFDWLEKYLDDGEPYIGISPYLRSTQDQLIDWLDQCFTRVTDSEGRPRAKTHGFGATAHEVLWRYPWHSADSTTWAIAPCYGMLVLPQCDTSGEFNVRAPARQFYVGGGVKLGSNKEAGFVLTHGGMFDWAAGRNVDSLGDIGLDWLHKFAELCGTSVTAFRSDQYARTAAHIKYLLMLEEQRGEVLFAHKRATFAQAMSRRKDKRPAKAKVDFRVIFATNLTHKQGQILTRFNVRHRLLSYWNLRDSKTLRERLERYVMTGNQTTVDRTGVVGGEILLKEPAVKPDWKTTNYIDFRRRRLDARLAIEDVIEDGPEAAP